MKISFLVTYYNQEQYVRQSLDSILAIEKPEEWEILVGDDGSSDETVNIVMEYIRKYPNHIFLYVMPRDPDVRYAPVKRASANRLNLLEKCTGDCFCILDGDDWYCDRLFVKEALAVLSSQLDVSVVLFGYQHVMDGIVGQRVTLPERMDGKKIDPAEYLRSYYVPSGACVHRKAYGTDRLVYLKKIGFFDDNDIVINSINYGGMYCICKVIYSYRQTATSTYNSMNALEQAVLNVQGYDVDKQLVDGEYAEVLLRRNVSNIIRMYLWRKEIQEMLGSVKYNRYLNECQILENSLGYLILKYGDLNHTEQKKLQKTILQICCKYKKRAIKLLLKKWLQKKV